MKRIYNEIFKFSRLIIYYNNLYKNLKINFNIYGCNYLCNRVVEYFFIADLLILI
jgi:hypothetical protein